MPKHSERSEPLTDREVFDACQQVSANSQRVTIDTVYAVLKRGSRNTIQEKIQRWRSQVAAGEVAPNIPLAVLESLNTWFGDEKQRLADSARTAIDQAERQAATCQQSLESERAARVAAEQAAEVLRQRERAQELALVTAQAARESAEGELAREKALAAERQAAHVAESSRLNAQLEAARQAKDAAVKAEGERVAAQMQAQVDRALVAQDDFRRRADAAVAESTKLREQLTAAQVELARAEAKTVRVKEIAQKFVEQAVSRAEQAEKELLKLTPGFALEGPLLDHLTVRASRLTERLVGMIERLGESTEQVVQFYRLGAALTPLEAAAALHAAADETLRRRGTSLEQEVSQSRQNVEGATG